MEDNSLAHRVIGKAIEIHRILGQGLTADTYRTCLKHELDKENINYEMSVKYPIEYKDTMVENAISLDFIIENELAVNLFSSGKLHYSHTARMIKSLKAAELEIGLNINYNTRLLKDGIKRITLHKDRPAYNKQDNNEQEVNKDVVENKNDSEIVNDTENISDNSEANSSNPFTRIANFVKSSK